MQGALAFSHFLMPVALKLLDYCTYAYSMSGVCFWIGEGNIKEGKKEGKEFLLYRVGTKK